MIQNTKNGPPVLNATGLRILACIMDAPVGVPPTFRQLRFATGVGNNAITCQLHRLRRLGLVTWERGEVRTIKATCRFVRG